MGKVVFEERLSCSSCHAILICEYARDADTHSTDVMIQCPACHERCTVTLARPAAVFLVRLDGAEPVMQARLGG